MEVVVGVLEEFPKSGSVAEKVANPEEKDANFGENVANPEQDVLNPGDAKGGLGEQDEEHNMAIVEAKKDECHPVMMDVNILEHVFSSIMARDLVRCRRAVSLWNKEILRILSKKKKPKLRIRLDERENLDDLAKMVSTLSDSMKEGSLVPFVSVDLVGDNPLYRESPFPNHNDEILDLNDTPAFKNFGLMIHHLRIGLRDIAYVMKVLRWCPNLDSLTLEIWVPDERKQDIIVDDGEIIPMNQFERLELQTNMKWDFGKILGKWAPNMKELEYSDEIGSGFVHFVDQLSYMNTGIMTHVRFDQIFNDLPHVTAYAKLAQMNWSNLKEVAFPSTACSGHYFYIAPEFWTCVSKMAKSLTKFPDLSNLGVMFIDDEEHIPDFPNVTTAYIPHAIVTQPDFFGKMPRLKKLRLGMHNWNIRRCVIVNSNGQPIEKQNYNWANTECGFFHENTHMWRSIDIGGKWRPHNDLEILEIGLRRWVYVPETLALMFPNLKKLVLNLHPEGMPQLQHVIHVMKNHKNLTTLNINSRLCHYEIPLALIGLPEKHWALISNYYPVSKLERLLCDGVEKPSLRDLQHLQKFTLSVPYIRNNRDIGQKTEEMLKMYCFSHMNNLREWDLGTRHQ